MRVNADFSQAVVVTPQQYAWVPSPMQGVERVMLDRIGAEKGHATSIVRYAPNSSFPSHLHPGGEEIFVLSGTFSDGERDHPAGCYLRNPPGSSHHPSSRQGTTILVKLWQMRPGETRHVRVDTTDPASWRREGAREICRLYKDDLESVTLQRLAPGQALLQGAVDGVEVLVLQGVLAVDGKACDAGSWIRLPAGSQVGLVAAAQGATIYLKTGHLGGLEQGAAT